MQIKEVVKAKQDEFFAKYKRKLLQKDLYRFLGFTKQNVHYKHKKQDFSNKYIEAIQKAKIEKIAKWLIDDLKKSLK